MLRRPPRSTQSRSSAASDVYKRQGKEIVVNGNIVIPPYGTTARRYMGVMGTRRLELGDGYGIHGTDHPESIGQSVSHGCVRLRNEDIERLYPMVAVGTPVYIY